jgi:DNA-3-methyladenine glycosylase
MDKMKLLEKSFYQNSDVVQCARDLLGKILLTNVSDAITSGIIVETEAYRGFDDRGCHAFGGRFTERTKTMYLAGGHAYVYVCYGIHAMVNVVIGQEGDAHAILIRAVQPLSGIESMMLRRKMSQNKPVLTNGPGKLTVAMDISKDMDGLILYEKNSPMQILQNDIRINENQIVSGPRVGMSKHVGNCSHRPWRFYIKNNPWVSKPLVVNYTGKW